MSSTQIEQWALVRLQAAQKKLRKNDHAVKRRMSLPQLQVGGTGRFILRHFLGCVRCFFSSENGGESPEVPMTDDLPEMLFGE